jgi:hypothetical protein
LQSGYTNTIVWDKLFKPDFLDKNTFRFIEGLTLEDVVFCFDTYLKKKSVKYFDIKFYNYRSRPGSIMETKSSDWGLRRRKIAALINEIVNKNRANTPAINGFMVFQYFSGFKFDGYGSWDQIKEFLLMELKAKKRFQCILMPLLSTLKLSRLLFKPSKN